MPRLFEPREPIIYKRDTEPTTGSWLDRLLPFLKKEIKEPKVIEEPKITESKEFVAGQIGEGEEERRRQVKEAKNLYRQILSQVYTSEKDITRLNIMELSELEEAYGKYQEWEMQRRDEQITQFAEQLGIPFSYLEQMRGAYPPEELESRITGLGGWMNLMRQKPTIGTYENIMETLFPEREPTLEEEIRTGKVSASQLEALERMGLLPEGIEMKEKEPTVEEKAGEIMKVRSKIEAGELDWFDLPIDYLFKYEMLNYVPATDLIQQGFLLQEGLEDIANEIQGGTSIEELIPLVMETQEIDENMAKLYILKAGEWLRGQGI